MPVRRFDVVNRLEQASCSFPLQMPARAADQFLPQHERADIRSAR
jgi:hypothetical protein